MELPPEGDRPPFDPSDTAELQAYYTARVGEIDARLDQGEEPEHIEGYITSGGYCHIFHDSDTNTVIKMPRVLAELTGSDDDEVILVPPEAGTVQKVYKAALDRGKGIPGLEQIVTTVDDYGQAGRGAVICEFVPGLTLEKLLDGEGHAGITDEHFDWLIETLVSMSERGIVIDNDPSNIIYDEDDGFTIIDYLTIEYDRERYPQRQGDIMTTLREIGRSSKMLQPTYAAFHILVQFSYAIRRRFGQEVADEMFSGWLSGSD